MLELDESVQVTIHAHRIAHSSGDVKMSPLDTHMNYNRLKIAALFALMHKRTKVEVSDWIWAGWIIEHNVRTRATLIETLSDKQQEEARKSGALKGIERVAADEAGKSPGVVGFGSRAQTAQ